MKKVLLSAFILLNCGMVSAQVSDSLLRYVYDLSKDSAKSVATDMAGLGKRQFVYNREFVSKAAHAQVYVFTDSADSTNELRIVFNLFNKGLNEALEIPGVPRYYFATLSGKFLDVFPIWIKYFHPDADSQQAAGFMGDKVRYKARPPYLATFKMVNDNYEILLR